MSIDTADVCYSRDLTAEQRKAATEWMEVNCDLHMDECNEVNCTGLAEACAEALGLYGNGVAIIHEVFEIAWEVAS